MARKEVVRSCCVCRHRGEKDQFIRVVRKPDGTVEIDRNLKIPGRGVYLCRNVKCIEKAGKTKAVERSLKCPGLPAELYERIMEECR